MLIVNCPVKGASIRKLYTKFDVNNSICCPHCHNVALIQAFAIDHV